jgi:hypothetical protein
MAKQPKPPIIEDRFVVKGQQEHTVYQNMYVLIDRVTGVNYLWIVGTSGNGLTPLYNPDGTPMVG